MSGFGGSGPTWWYITIGRSALARGAPRGPGVGRTRAAGGSGFGSSATGLRRHARLRRQASARQPRRLRVGRRRRALGRPCAASSSCACRSGASAWTPLGSAAGSFSASGLIVGCRLGLRRSAWTWLAISVGDCCVTTTVPEAAQLQEQPDAGQHRRDGQQHRQRDDEPAAEQAISKARICAHGRLLYSVRDLRDKARTATRTSAPIRSAGDAGSAPPGGGSGTAPRRPRTPSIERNRGVHQLVDLAVFEQPVLREQQEVALLDRPGHLVASAPDVAVHPLQRQPGAGVRPRDQPGDRAEGAARPKLGRPLHAERRTRRSTRGRGSARRTASGPRSRGARRPA